MKRALIVGAGFSGLASACLLLKSGWEVTILEKNEAAGGRARLWTEKGYRFDMGPSWYLMPEVFEHFLERLGRKKDDVYNLTKLQTHYQVFFEGLASCKITENFETTKRLFESFEEGGSGRLERFMAASQEKYDIALGAFLYKDYRTIWDFFNGKVLTRSLGLGIFKSLESFVNRFFSDRRARQILEYAMVFLGNAPGNAPALYSILSYVDLKLGVYFPEGGMNGVARALERVVQKGGGKILYGHEVTKLEVEKGRFREAVTEQGRFQADLVLNCGDYAWGETRLLEPRWQTYRAGRWKKKVWAPSMFLVFLGIRKLLPGLEHHNLFFSAEWERHFETIFKSPSWPDNPCFYLSAITKTDPRMAPPGCENLFLLVPIAPGLEDGEDVRRVYLKKLLDHVEKVIGETFQDEIEVCRVFSRSDFQKDYLAWEGTALGLAHTLFQTAIFRPAHKSRKVSNLYYSGQYTHPGVGVPMTLISAEIVTDLINREGYG